MSGQFGTGSEVSMRQFGTIVEVSFALNGCSAIFGEYREATALT